MVEVLPVQNMDDIKQYLSENNINIPEPSLVMQVYDNGVKAGLGALSLIDYKCVLTYLHTVEQLELMLGKSLLNMADLRGIKQVYCFDTNLTQISKKLGFKEETSNDGLYTKLDLEGYFDAKCGHCN